MSTTCRKIRAIQCCFSLTFVMYIHVYNCQEVSKKDPECISVTGCCTKNAINSSCEACKTGYHGGKCANQCPSKCLNCTDHPEEDTNVTYQGRGYCRHCQKGYYSNSDRYQCQTRCQVGCLLCVSFIDANFTCVDCTSGFYLVNLTSNYGECRKCPLNCRTCTGDDNCTECSLGYFGNICEKSCSIGCVEAICDKYTGICAKGCVSDGYLDLKMCKTCLDGRYGYTCKQHCAENCLNNRCEQSNGHCFNCTDHFVGTFCSTCIEGWYGFDCNEPCPTPCKNKSCNETTKTCDECKEGFAALTCDECVAGRYGTECDKSCPINCFNSSCNRTSGECDRCASHFSGSKCETCLDGFYGRNCSSVCSRGCRQGKCNQENGSCFSCIDYKFGLFCENNCSHNCQRSECYQKTGTCITGCKSGYSGDKCCANFSSCSQCSSDGICHECIAGIYGDMCDKPCQYNCLNNICYKDNGTCKSCKKQYGGLLCDKTSSEMSFESNEQSQVGVITGTVAGVAILFVIFVVVIFVFRRRKAIQMGGSNVLSGKIKAFHKNQIPADGAEYINLEIKKRQQQSIEDILSSGDTDIPLGSSHGTHYETLAPERSDDQQYTTIKF